jgi:hypothetical protein
MRVHSDVCSRLARITLIVMLTVAWSGALAPLARAQSPASEPAAPADATQREKQFAAVMQRLCRIGEREISKPGADGSDVRQKAAELNNDSDRIFAFVRDDVRYEPYRGVLRGARGTLLAMSGNSLDKSLLLQEMLQAGGYNTRLVRGELPADQATALVTSFLQAPPSKLLAEPASNGGEGSELLKSIADETGLSLKALGNAIDSQRQQFVDLTTQAWATTDRETPLLRQRLDDAKISLGQPFAQRQADLVAKAQQHTWLEMADPADASKWIAMDASLPNSQRGETHATGEPLNLAAADEHSITLRLVYIRKGDAEKPEEKDLINAVIPTRQAAVDFEQLSINPADALPSASQLAAMSPEQAIKMLASIKKFQPGLRIGARTIFGQVFDLKGNTYQVAADGRVAGASQLGTAAGGLFGGGALGGDDGGNKDDDGPGRFLELAVVIELASPGEPAVQQKRVLLTAADVTGEHRRSPLLTWDLLVQPGPIPGKWVAYRATRNLLSAAVPVIEATSRGELGTKDLDSIASLKPEPCPTLLLGLALARQSAIAKQLHERGQITTVWDSPFVAIADRSFCMNASKGHACGRERIDIVDNTLRYLPRTGDADAERGAVDAAMRQGVFDTAAEAIVLRQSLTEPGSPPNQNNVFSAIDDLAKARSAGDPLSVYRVESGKPAPSELALANADRLWVASYERSSHVVVAPSKPVADVVASGWWTIDPQTGCVLGRQSGGRGSAMSEKAVVTNLVAMHVCMISPVVDAFRGKGNTPRGGLKIGIAMVGCIVGFGVGNVAILSENVGLFWAIFQAVFVIGDKILDD